MAKIILVDANALAFRSLFSHDALTVKYGKKTIFTGMAYGFIRKLIEVYNDFNPTRFIIFWDGGSDNKKKIYPDYKKGRKLNAKEMNYNDIKASLKICRKLMRYAGVEQYRIPGEEADDLISSYIAQYDDNTYYILSNDHDMFQLLNKNVFLLRMKQGETKKWNRKIFRKEHGFKSKYYPHYLSIVGDSTDHIPGIKGIGKMTATKIFLQLNRPTLKTLYEQIDTLDISDKIKEKIINGKKDAELFYKIIKLKKDLELQPLNSRKQKAKKLMELLIDLEFRSIYENEDRMSALCALG